MRTAWNLTLGQERERFALRHTCEYCGHFDPAAQRCRHEWPTAGHRRADYEAVAAAGGGEVTFCKEFELC